jgi:hypothetical protein
MRCHFTHLIVEGLKKVKVKPLNDPQVTSVQQGPDENPFTFLQHLKDTILKHTWMDPETQVWEVLLMNKFLPQSEPDICRKCQKSVAERKKSLDKIIQLSTSIYYNWDLTKKREKDKEHHDLITVCKEYPLPTGTYIPCLLPLWKVVARCGK